MHFELHCRKSSKIINAKRVRGETRLPPRPPSLPSSRYGDPGREGPPVPLGSSQIVPTFIHFIHIDQNVC